LNTNQNDFFDDVEDKPIQQKSIKTFDQIDIYQFFLGGGNSRIIIRVRLSVFFQFH